MKGIGKALARTPFMVTSKVGLSKKSTDAEFGTLQRQFSILETAAEKLIKETKAFSTAVVSLFTSGESFAKHFNTVFHPITNEFDIESKFPDSIGTFSNVDGYTDLMDEMKGSVASELDLIDSRVVGPVKELQGILKSIRKTITKRDHKLTDYDRYNNSLTKLRDKKEKSLKDERNLFKLEQEFEIATNDYNNINEALKNELPQFMILVTRFMDPLFQSFFYMQINIYYLILEKLQGFSEGKYDISLGFAEIGVAYEERKGDAQATVENMQIVKKIISVSRMVQAKRSASNSSSTSPSTSTPPSRAASTFKKPPPPPPPSLSRSSTQATHPPPPPYSQTAFSPKPSLGPKPSLSTKPVLTPKPSLAPKPSVGTKPAFGASSFASSNGAFAAAAASAASMASKRPPPPPPPLPPSRARPNVQYVVAMYDFTAQADGDLSFKAGDRIEIIERSANAEEWWTGKVNGMQGVFPGNYVQDA